ncbi:MAG TPA: glycosyltransferase family 2 protein [Actinomycetota bacterium]|nr:glycosyltransferase family 2 protein [Actinomycetota bacterium]
MTANPPRVYTIVLNYMRSDDTIRCVSSLRDSTYRDQFLVVVDNGSGREARRELAEGLGSVPLIESGENLGFAGGNNLGIVHGLDRGADYVWILNPDTVVEAGTLERLVRTMSRFPEAGIVGSRILRGDDGATVLFNGGRIDWSRGGKPVLPGMGKPEAAMPPAKVTTIDYATGASMLVRRRLFEEIGLLPERYFLYFEETDFNTRAIRAGWKVLLEPRSRVLHFRRSWANVPSPYYVFYFVRNRILFGRTFSTAPTDVMVDDLHDAITSWRTKIARRGPDLAAAFERVVADALADGTAMRDGPRPEYNALRWEELSDV